MGASDVQGREARGMKVLSLWHGEILVSVRDTMRDIAFRICDEEGLSISELIGRSQERRLAWPRQRFCFEARALGKTLPQIGRFINRDHTTVIYSIRRYKDRCAHPPEDHKPVGSRIMRAAMANKERYLAASA